MECLDLRDLFTVAHFIKTRCDHGLKAGATKDKNYVFFEVEILDPKSKAQLCYLDKVRWLRSCKRVLLHDNDVLKTEKFFSFKTIPVYIDLRK